MIFCGKDKHNEALNFRRYGWYSLKKMHDNMYNLHIIQDCFYLYVNSLVWYYICYGQYGVPREMDVCTSTYQRWVLVSDWSAFVYVPYARSNKNAWNNQDQCVFVRTCLWGQYLARIHTKKLNGKNFLCTIV